MALPTVAVTCQASDQNGNFVAGAEYTAQLDQTETYGGFVVPELIEAKGDANGLAILRLWPNALGVAGSKYRITAVNPDTGRRFLDITVVVPNSACNLHQIQVQAPFPLVSASEQALIAAQGALAPVTAQAALAAASRVASDAAAQLSASRAAAAGVSAATANTAAATATQKAGDAESSRAHAETHAQTAALKAAEAAASALIAVRAAATNATGATPDTTAVVALATQQADAAAASASAAATSANVAGNAATASSNSATASNSSKVAAAASAVTTTADASAANTSKLAAAASAAAAATSASDAAASLASTGATGVADVNAAAATAITQVNTAKTDATTAITNARAELAATATTAKNDVNAAAAAAVNTVNTANSTAAASATAATTAKNDAVTAKTAAETAATTATTKATDATTKAGEAATSATAAQTAKTAVDTKAAEAVASATGASNSATAASTSATASATSATASVTAKTAAETAKTAAETARADTTTLKTATDTAKTAAETAATSATAAKTAAETARTGAQTAQTAAQTAATSATATADGIVLKETALVYGANGNVPWDGTLGTVAYLALNVPVTTLGLPTGLGLAPVALTLIADQDATGNRQIIFAAGYRVKAATLLGANTRTIYGLTKRSGANGQVTGGADHEGIPLSGALAAPATVTLGAITSSSMVVSWSAVANATAYNVYRDNVKVNPSPITGLDYTAGGLTASTAYVWKVRALGGTEESGDSPTITGTTSAVFTGAQVAIIAAPAKVSEIFFEAYEWPHSFTLNDIDSRFNTAILFTCQPAGTPAVPNKRDNLGDGTFQFLNASEAPISNDKIAAFRASGRRVLLAVGGADNGFNFNTRQRSINFLNSFKQIVTNLGGKIDGIYWNTFEAYLRQVYKDNPASVTVNTGELVWLSQQLQLEYSSNFTITMAPTPNAYGNAQFAAYSPYDLVIARALRAGGCLTYISPQYYDEPSFKTVNTISDFHKQWADEFGANMVVMGLSHGNRFGDFSDCPTLAETDREVTRAQTLAPGGRGFYMWSMHDKIASTAPDFLTSMVAKFNATTPVPVTPPATGEQAAIDAFAYNGGQIGAWFDHEPARLRLGTTASSAVSTGIIGERIGRVMDRSAHGNDIYSLLATDQWPGFYRNAINKAYGAYGTGLASTTGGGSGEAAANGFTLCMTVKPNGYYYTAWSDAASAFTGRSLLYDADVNGLVFRVGTGTSRVEAIVTGLGTMYTAPTAAFRVKAWHDRVANTINLQVNDGAVVTVACPTFAAGSNNFSLSGDFANAATNGFGDVFSSVHVYSALTTVMRDNLSAYVNGKMV